MNFIHENEVNKHDLINISKRTKHLNSYYFPILHECMNKQKCRAKFYIFGIILDNGCSSRVVIISKITKLNPK